MKTGNKPIEEMIWKSFQKKEITCSMTDFLWKTMHGAQKCRKFWLNIPRLEERANCPLCGTMEDMDHILTKCNTVANKMIWEEVEDLWRKKKRGWMHPSIGLILGYGTVTFQNANGKVNSRVGRLLTIIMTEAAHLIWKLRCERRIERNDIPANEHTGVEARNRWHKVITEQLTLDRAMA